MSENDARQRLRAVRTVIDEGRYAEAFAALQRMAAPADDFVLQSRYATYYRSIPANTLTLRPLRLALLASSTVSHFKDVLRFWLACAGLDAEIFESEYNTIHQTVLDPGSPLYAFQPDITVLFTHHRDVKLPVAAGAPEEEIAAAVHTAVQDCATLWRFLQEHSHSFIIQNNADLPDTRPFGNYEATAPWSRLNLLRRFNLELGQAATSGVTLFDLEFLSARYGKQRWHNTRYWYHSKHAFDLDATGPAAHALAQCIGAVKGLAKKCIVLDLDNTLWGGVVADDGVEGIQLGAGADGEAFVDFQRYLKELKNRGILLAVCSKNQDDIARLPFQQHPDMQLTLDDIAVFTANWNDKASNIRDIAGILNIGLDALVFVDDNPAERALVRNYLPMVCVPEMPEDPAGYIATLDAGCHFETLAFSAEDKARHAYYRDNASRKQFEQQFASLSDFLKNLNMEAETGDFDAFHLPRIVQLINKSNQFNLTTIRYTEKEITDRQSDERYICRWYTLKDTFGDNGMISAVILEKREPHQLLIDTWVMSCRVLSRGMEEFIASDIAAIARREGCRTIIGRYIPTPKNALVADLYQRLQFTRTGDNNNVVEWMLPVTDAAPVYTHYIRSTTANHLTKAIL